jgi:hypothetical protein
MKALFGGEEGGGYLRLWSKNTSFGASSSTPVYPAAPAREAVRHALEGVRPRFPRAAGVGCVEIEALLVCH